jgi:acetyl esterase/lipase
MSDIYPLSYLSRNLFLIVATQILVGGDSAGGNLAIALISNVLHPHPAVPPLTLNGQLAGLLLISPWVIFSTSAPSFEECEHKDIHGKAALHDWADDFASPADRNNYTEPLRADVSWWSGQCAKKILNLAGEYEMFRDDLEAFGRVLEKAKLDVKTISCPKQVHIDCILDAQSGLEPGLMSEEIWKWLDTAYQE